MSVGQPRSVLKTSLILPVLALAMGLTPVYLAFAALVIELSGWVWGDDGRFIAQQLSRGIPSTCIGLAIAIVGLQAIWNASETAKPPTG